MPLLTHPIATIVLPSSLRFGSFRLSVYGLSAALGLVAGMVLAGELARRTGVGRENAWDMGLAAVLACLLTSRLLLIFGDPAAFLRYPLVVLQLPSLTLGAAVLAGVLTFLAVHRKGLPLLPLLDVFTPPAALLAALLEFGHALENSEPGMPRALSWNSSGSPLHPVSLYGSVASLLILLVTVVLLRQGPVAGRVASVGLMLGGLSAFGLDMLSQPLASFAGWVLEPGQWMALLSVTAGALLWTFAPTRKPASTAAHLQSPPPAGLGEKS